MSKNKKKRILHSLVITIVLVIGSVFSGLIVFGESDSLEEDDIVIMAYADSVKEVEKLGEYGDIIDHYGRNVLIEITESDVEELKEQFETNTLDYRNKIDINGYEFFTDNGLPEIKEELKRDDYDPRSEGLYLVDMIGPVNPEWKEKLEGKGLEILNYVPNYAYVVSMSQGQVEKVEDLFFVDWVGVYQPAFKLAENVEPGLISVTFLDAERSIMAIEEEEQLFEIANRNDVYHINQYFEPQLYDEMATQTIGGGLWIWDPENDPDSAYRGHGDYGSLATQMGYDGEGIVVAVADTGIGDGTTSDAGHPDFDGRVIGGYDYESDSYEEGEWADGHGHGTHVAGSVAGHTHGGTGEKVYEDYYAAEGTAPGSELYAVKVFDDSGSWIGGSDYHEIVEIPKQAEEDVYIHTNSWGYDTQGEYIASDADFDRAVRDANRDSEENEPMIITVAAGNDGPENDGGYNTVGSPGNAKNVITVGSTGNYPYNSPEAVSGFSSRGWTNDNRVKPDVMAPGENVYSTEPGGDYRYDTGTSMATPAVAGAAASVVDWYESNYGTKPSPSMVRALLINTAYDLVNEQEEMGENSPYIPNQDEGWGMVNLPNIVHTDVNMMLVNEESLIETGEVHEYEIEQDDDTEPLRISLTWTDAVPNGEVDGTLNNDLNLEVESPSGEIYRGNNLVESWSVAGEDTYDTFDTNDDGWDDVNNVQNVYLLPDDVEEGTYTVRVIGNDVPLDANNDGEANQDYSLVNWNAVDLEPGPLSPSDSDPEDGATGVPTEVELSVFVEHEEGENMDIYFQDASDDSLIGEDNDIQSGDRAYVTWEGLESGTKYSWYAVADDGTRTATSDTWSFTTEAENHTLTMDSTEGGFVKEPGEGVYDYESGTTVNLEAVADEDYDFVEWSGDVETIENITANNTTITMEDDYSVTAKFEIVEAEDVVIYPEDDQELDAGEELEFTAEAYDEQGRLITDDVGEFTWQNIHDIDSEENVAVFYKEERGEYNVTATYENKTSPRTTITVNPTDADYIEISPQDSQIKAGETQTYEATAYDQYDNVISEVTQETNWSIEEGAGGSWDQITGTYESENDGTWTVMGEYEGLEDTATLTVVEAFDLTINIVGEGSTDPMVGTHTFDEGEVVSVKATPAEGWEFVNWTGDVPEDEEGREINVTIEEDIEITVHFEEKDADVPGFTSSLLLVTVVMSVVIYKKKKG